MPRLVKRKVDQMPETAVYGAALNGCQDEFKAIDEKDDEQEQSSPEVKGVRIRPHMKEECRDRVFFVQDHSRRFGRGLLLMHGFTVRWSVF
jgi:hypothetical protein